MTTKTRLKRQKYETFLETENGARLNFNPDLSAKQIRYIEKHSVAAKTLLECHIKRRDKWLAGDRAVLESTDTRSFFAYNFYSKIDGAVERAILDEGVSVEEAVEFGNLLCTGKVKSLTELPDYAVSDSIREKLVEVFYCYKEYQRRKNW